MDEKSILEHQRTCASSTTRYPRWHVAVVRCQLTHPSSGRLTAPLKSNVGPYEGVHAEGGAISSRQRRAIAATAVVRVTASRYLLHDLLPKHCMRGIVSPNPSFERKAKSCAFAFRSISTLGNLTAT